eukprot:TRINITY_DN291_c0_g1_i6.p1 TRINITY_DN291_c0_g1~~TRINITY_DN291_c0_g1_i6.p1  ORF type:complete len:159 (+),score=57.89 TRINITY_DN291_c0_g1_i6:180-656(+)
MGRGRGSPSFSAPKRTATASKPTSSSSSTASRSTAMAPARPTTPATPHAPAPAPAASSGGGGLLTGIMANAASTAIGYTAAHSAMSALGIGMYGGNKEAPTDAATVSQTTSRLENGPCGIQYQSFLKCLEANNSNISSCQWAQDMFTQCNSNLGGNKL